MTQRVMTVEQQNEWYDVLMRYDWTETITITAREDTVSGLWLNVKKGLVHASKLDPTLRYFVVGSVGKLRGCSHFHGLLYDTQKQVRKFNAGFRGCNEPHRTPINNVLNLTNPRKNIEQWLRYTLNQGLQGYQLHNMTMENNNAKEIHTVS